MRSDPETHAPRLHAVPPLRSTESRASRIERALHMLTDLMADKQLPLEWREKLWEPYADLHALRDPDTVARMEREAGLR